MTKTFGVASIAALVGAIMLVDGVHAQQATNIQLAYTNGQFQPSDVSAPADTPLTLRIKNIDVKAMEFESKSLRVEKIIAAKSEGLINVRALKPGRYEFYDDFNETARGTLTVK
jgi:hypothetical protein